MPIRGLGARSRPAVRRRKVGTLLSSTLYILPFTLYILHGTLYPLRLYLYLVTFYLVSLYILRLPLTLYSDF